MQTNNKIRASRIYGEWGFIIFHKSEWGFMENVYPKWTLTKTCSMPIKLVNIQKEVTFIIGALLFFRGGELYAFVSQCSNEKCK